MNEFTLAGKGLKYLFLSQILALAAAVLLVIPVVGKIAFVVLGIVSMILRCLGPYVARDTHPHFKNAFYMTIAALVVGLISINPNGFPVFAFLAVLLNIVKAVISLAIVYFVCTASETLLDAKGNGELAHLAVIIWELCAGCTLVSVVCTLVGWIPLLNILAAVASVVAFIVQLVASVLLIIFYYKASNFLLSE